MGRDEQTVLDAMKGGKGFEVRTLARLTGLNERKVETAIENLSAAGKVRKYSSREWIAR